MSYTTIYYPTREESWAVTAKKYFLDVKAFVAECIPEHTMGEWETIKEPTVDLYGEEKRSCLYCDEFEERDIPKLTPQEPDPTESTEPAVTEPSRPSQPQTTEPTASAPAQIDTPDGKDEKPALNGFAIAVIAASVLAAAGAVALAIHSKRSE